MRPRHLPLCVIALAVLLTAAVAGEADATLPPIQPLDAPKPTQAVFKAARRTKPLELTTLEAAAPYFTEKALEELKAKADFAHVKLLIFAWHGSGQDRLTHAVAESYPEQIFFRIHPGRTRDLRPHLHLFLLRANVRWSVK